MGLEELRIDRSRRARRRRSPWVGRVVVLLLLVVLAVVFGPALVRFADRIRLPEVETAVVVAADPAAAGAVRGKAANGYVVAARRAALSADTPGRIVEMRVTEGSVVKKGDVVARLYSDELEAAVRGAEAELEVARAGLERARAEVASVKAETERLERRTEAVDAALAAARSRHSLRKTEVERAKKLIDEGVITQSEYDDARTAFESAEADLKAASAELLAARADERSVAARAEVAAAGVKIAEGRVTSAAAVLEQARAALDKTYVRAPFDGVVVLKDAEVGEVVSPNSQGGSSARGSVVTMVDFASLEVQANVPETSLEAVRVGAPCSIHLDAYPEVTYRGRVDRIWPTADRVKGTIEVRIAFLEPDERLRPELGVRVVFLPEGEAVETERGEPAVLVGEDALVTLGDKRGVFVLERDVVRFRELALGSRRGGRVEVKAGLDDGERIVVRPPASLGDGDRVRISE